MANTMIEDICSKIKDGMENLPAEPQYEKVTLDDGFCCMQFVKPKFYLSKLGYNYLNYKPSELTSIIKNVVNEMNIYYGDSGIYVKCKLPTETVKDVVFEISFP